MKSVNKTLLLFTFVLFTVNFTLAQTASSASELYKQEKYEEAIKLLKQTVKKNSADVESWYLLGSSYLKTGKTKEAEKAFDKVVELKPDDSQGYAGIASAKISLGKNNEAQTSAQKAVELNAQNYEAHYILGLINFSNGSYNNAYQRAEKAIKINQNYAEAYLLKSESLTSSFGETFGVVMKSPTQRPDLLKEAVVNMESYLKLAAKNADQTYWVERLENLRFFSEYYGKPETMALASLDSKPPEKDVTPIKIISKPPPSYTNFAREKFISGTVRLVINFAADKKIKNILVIKGLEKSLNREAIKAARSIKYEPATKNDQPISVVKTIEYHFSIY